MDGGDKVYRVRTDCIVDVRCCLVDPVAYSEGSHAVHGAERFREPDYACGGS